MNPAFVFGPMRFGGRRYGIAPAPAPSSGITPAMTVGYMDTSNVRHWDSVTDGVTTITGVAPFLVEFFGGDTRSEETDADDDVGAWWNIGYHIDYGEALGGTWSRSGRPKDTDRGGPMFAHTYTTAGTFECRMTCRDSAGNQAFIRVNVVVTMPEVDVVMTSGVIPTWTDNTVYGAPAGGTWGDFNTNGRSNIIIMKTGEGADPVFGIWTVDGRNETNAVINRTNGVRFWNCDVARMTCGNVSFDYCGVVGGRLRTIALPGMQYSRDQLIENNRTAQQAANVRMLRGMFLHDCGEVNPVAGTDYVQIGEGRGCHWKNVWARRTDVVGVQTEHNLRGVYAYSSFRHVLFTCETTAFRSFNKFNGWDCILGVDLTDSGGGIPVANGVPDEWQADDTLVEMVPDAPTAGTARRRGLPSSRIALSDNVYGSAADGEPEANVGAGPENNDALQPGQGAELVSHEYSIWYRTTITYNASYTGRGVGMRECYFNMGAGSAVGISAGTDHPRRTPDGWEGPYFTSGSRPVVVL